MQHVGPRRDPRQQRARVASHVVLELAEGSDQQPSLVHRAAEVTARDIVAIAREREGVASQHQFRPRREVGVGVRVVHGVGDVDADPSDSVDQLLEAGEPRQDVSVDRHAGQLFDGLHHQVRSMEERLVDLPGSDAGDGDVGIPRDPEDRDRALRGVDADDVERIAARRRGRLAGPCIAPDHQDEERSGGGQTGRAGGLADLRVQILEGRDTAPHVVGRDQPAIVQATQRE